MKYLNYKLYSMINMLEPNDDVSVVFEHDGMPSYTKRKYINMTLLDNVDYKHLYSIGVGFNGDKFIYRTNLYDEFINAIKQRFDDKFVSEISIPYSELVLQSRDKPDVITDGNKVIHTIDQNMYCTKIPCTNSKDECIYIICNIINYYEYKTKQRYLWENYTAIKFDQSNLKSIRVEPIFEDVGDGVKMTFIKLHFEKYIGDVETIKLDFPDSPETCFIEVTKFLNDVLIHNCEPMRYTYL